MNAQYKNMDKYDQDELAKKKSNEVKVFTIPHNLNEKKENNTINNNIIFLRDSYSCFSR